MNIQDLEKQEQELSATLSDVRKRLKELRAKKWEHIFNVKQGDVVYINIPGQSIKVYLNEIYDYGSFCKLITNQIKKNGDISKNIRIFYPNKDWSIVKVEQ